MCKLKIGNMPNSMKSWIYGNGAPKNTVYRLSAIRKNKTIGINWLIIQ